MIYKKLLIIILFLIFVGLIGGNKEVIADNGSCIFHFTDISYDYWELVI